MHGKVLPKDFYNQPDVVQIARSLLGKVLCSSVDGALTSGKIVETEAYSGHSDLACHACRYGKTSRTEVMFREGGCLYVYLCYGIHHMVNIVTNQEGSADAVLIRALEPLEGVEKMMERRNKGTASKITAGPGTVGEALGIQVSHTGTLLAPPLVWLEERSILVSDDEIESGKRIGVDYAGDDAMKPWRFYIRNHPFVSKK